jgi:hypothetical protein
LGDLFDFTLTGTLTVATASVSAALTAADTITEITGLFSSTGSNATKFTGGSNARAILATFTDGSLLVVDVDGNGTFTAADVVVNITGVTTTSFTAAVFV